MSGITNIMLSQSTVGDGLLAFSLPSSYTITVQNSDYKTTFSVNDCQGLDFNNDGTIGILGDHIADSIREVSLDTPYDWSAGSLTASFDDGINVVMRSVWYDNTGSKVFFIDENRDEVVSHDITNYSLAAPSGRVVLDVQAGSPILPNLSAACMNDAGTILYVSGDSVIHQYNLSTAYDLSSATFVAALPLTSNSLLGMIVDPAEKGIMFITATALTLVNISEAADISDGIELTGDSRTITGGILDGITHDPDGNLYIIQGSTADDILKLTLS